MIWLIILLGLGLRLISLNQSFWMDEAISAVAVKTNSFLELLTKFAPGDTHPPLYYLLLKFWSAIFGYSEISLRLPSVILGVATIYVVYKIATLITNHPASPAGGRSLYTANLAALLFATSGLHIYYSQEARMYALTVFAVSLAFYFFLKVQEMAKSLDWILFSLSVLLIGTTDYLPLLILPVFWIYAIWTRKNKNWWKKFLLAHLTLAIFLLVWFKTFQIQSQSTASYLQIFAAWRSVLGTASLKELSLVWVKFILGRISFTPKIFYGLIVALASAPFLAGLFSAGKNFKENLLVWLWLVLPMVLAFCGSIFIPGFSYFRLLFILPAFCLLTAWGLSNLRLGFRIALVILALNLVFAGNYLFNRNFWREDWQGAVNFLDQNQKGDEPALMVYAEPFTPYRWYATRDLAKAVSLPFDKDTDKLLKKAHALYTFDYLLDLTDPHRKLFEELKTRGFKETKGYSFRGVGQIRYWQKI